MTKIPLALYIHFPWCLRKCPYCDFNSYLLPNQGELFEAYINKLLEDLASEAIKVGARPIHSIYFGGGTPSLMSVDAIKKIIDRAQNLFEFTQDPEITLEANPGTINLDSCAGFKVAGVNRMSLGIQSLSDERLGALGRIHDKEQALNAIGFVKQVGFNNFNLDLMFGLPGQYVNGAIKDLEMAVSYSPPHVSWYQLTLEPNTRFAANPPELPCKELLWDIQQAGQGELSVAGLLQYEVSAYSRVGYECKHNVNYWQYGDYLGIGAGAYGKITLDNGVVTRYAKVADPIEYIKAPNMIAEEKIVDRKVLPFEFMLNALRLYRPIGKELFLERTGLTFDAVARELQYAQSLGLIEIQNDEIITTPKGKNFLNDLLEIFL